MFHLYDTRAKCYLYVTYTTRKAAQKAADRLDNEYGAVRYVVMEKRN